MPNMMAALPNIGGTFYKSSLIPFLVPRSQAWLMPTARVPCSNAANIGKCKTWTQSEFCTWWNSIRGQEPPKCIYSVQAQETAKHRAVWLTSVERHHWSKEAKMQNLLKFAGVPKLANLSQPLVVQSSP